MRRCGPRGTGRKRLGPNRYRHPRRPAGRPPCSVGLRARSTRGRHGRGGGRPGDGRRGLARRPGDRDHRIVRRHRPTDDRHTTRSATRPCCAGRPGWSAASPLELPALPAGGEGRRGAGSRVHHWSSSPPSSPRCRRTCSATLYSRRACRPAWSTSCPGTGSVVGCGPRRAPRRRRRLLHRIDHGRPPGRAGGGRAAQARVPGTGWQVGQRRPRRRRPHRCGRRLGGGVRCSTAGRPAAPGPGCWFRGTRYAEAVELAAAHADAMVVGDPLDPATTLGPVISGRQRASIAAAVDGAVARGARLAAGGTDAIAERGHFLRPTVLADVDRHDPVARDEIFGPVLVVLPHDGDEDAIAAANDSDVRPRGRRLVGRPRTRPVGRGSHGHRPGRRQRRRPSTHSHPSAGGRTRAAAASSAASASRSSPRLTVSPNVIGADPISLPQPPVHQPRKAHHDQHPVRSPGRSPTSSARSSSCAVTSPQKEIRPRGREVDEADVGHARRHLRQGRRRSASPTS